MANGEGSDSESSGSGPSAGGDTPTPPMPHRHIDPVAPTLLGHHGVVHRGRPRWSTLALIAIFTTALVLYLVLSPG